MKEEELEEEAEKLGWTVEHLKLQLAKEEFRQLVKRSADKGFKGSGGGP